MGNFGFLEMGAVAVIALVVFGPERLPEVARNVARLVARFRAEAGRALEELTRASGLEGLDDELASIRADVRGVRDDLRGVRNDVTSELRGVRKPVSPGGPATHTPTDAATLAAAGGAAEADVGAGTEDVEPPPVDHEAT